MSYQYSYSSKSSCISVCLCRSFIQFSEFDTYHKVQMRNLIVSYWLSSQHIIGDEETPLPFFRRRQFSSPSSEKLGLGKCRIIYFHCLSNQVIASVSALVRFAIFPIFKLSLRASTARRKSKIKASASLNLDPERSRRVKNHAFKSIMKSAL